MLVIGAGGLALQLLDDLEAVYGADLFFWSNHPLQDNPITRHFQVLRSYNEVMACFQHDAAFIVAVGGPLNRQRLTKEFISLGGKPEVFRSPQSRVSRFATLAPGTVICSGALIEAGVEIGEGGLINAGCIVTHETKIGCYTELAPGVVIGGAAQIGRLGFVGLNATILPRISLGAHVTVGAGALVNKSFPDHVTIKGVPAR